MPNGHVSRKQQSARLLLGLYAFNLNPDFFQFILQFFLFLGFLFFGFCGDYDTFTSKKLQEKIRQVVEKVIYHSTHLQIHFKHFPWPYPYPLNQDPGISP